MRTLVSVLAIVLTAHATLPRAHAQSQHAATPAAIEAALQEHASSRAADRADVVRLLQHPDVRATAERVGIDLGRAHDAVAMVEGEDLRLLAEQSRQVEQALVGGQSTITISTTMIIIGLLVLILLVVALR
jgi:hypothetical protein